MVGRRHVWWSDLLGRDEGPVDICEESVLHYALDVDSQLGIGDQDPLDQVPRHRIQVLGQDKPARVRHLDYLLGWYVRPALPMRAFIISLIHLLIGLDFHGFGAEWSKASEQLTNQDPEAPHIRLVAIACPNQHFRSRIGGCATVRPGFLILNVLHLLGESKIYQLNVPVTVKQDILRLQISINYALFMQLLDCDQDFSQIED